MVSCIELGGIQVVVITARGQMATHHSSYHTNANVSMGAVTLADIIDPNFTTNAENDFEHAISFVKNHPDALKQSHNYQSTPTLTTITTWTTITTTTTIPHHPYL